MSILYDEERKIFHLATNKTSYVLEVVKDGYLAHRYWGKKISRFRDSNCSKLNKPIGKRPANNKLAMQLFEKGGKCFVAVNHAQHIAIVRINVHCSRGFIAFDRHFVTGIRFVAERNGGNRGARISFKIIPA